MPCYHPIKAWRNPKVSGSPVAFSPCAVYSSSILLPCSRCSGCRLDHSRVWAIRCAHEASLYEDNMFVTFTYDDENIPSYGSLNKRHLQLFWKKLRKAFPNRRIRYYACGEYGDQTERPHYHAIIFNLWMDDCKYWKSTPMGDRLYISDMLANIWGHGFVVIGSVTFDSAGYVARYVMKKRSRPTARDEDVRAEQERQYCNAYLRADPDTGEVVWLEEEFAVMSRRPGIGHDWYERFKDDTYPSDTVVFNGKEMKPPRYYDEKIRVEDSDLYESLKQDRMRSIYRNWEDNSPRRLADREICQNARTALYGRNVV